MPEMFDFDADYYTGMFYVIEGKKMGLAQAIEYCADILGMQRKEGASYCKRLYKTYVSKMKKGGEYNGRSY